MTNVTLERTAPTQNAPATYMPQAQGQAADRRIKEKAPADAPVKMGVQMCIRDSFEIQARKHVYNAPFLMGQGVWIDSEKLVPTDEQLSLIHSYGAPGV